MSEWNEAQGRINEAGYTGEQQAWQSSGSLHGLTSAVLALVDVVRQVGIEMLADHTTIYEMDETAQELAEPETLYVGGEAQPVTNPVTASDIEHYCGKERRVVDGARRDCPHGDCGGW